MAELLYRATGTGKLPSQFRRNTRINDPKLYRPSEGLVNAVNTALVLGQPLLLTGEPGTGKTQLAHHISYFFGLGEPLVFNAQTTSAAKDLFYRYDALGHFQYSQTNKEVLSSDQVEERFITYQALGKAIREDRRVVVLIDEVDKAPRDLPNDVLAALEDLAFKVPETGRSYKASSENRPIIVLTSNSEKNLPDAFLRRVVFFHIPFPEEATLLEILQLKIEDFPEKGFQSIIRHFERIRGGRVVKLKKNPATAELIFWTLLLHDLHFPVDRLENFESLQEADKMRLADSYSVLAKNKEDLHSLREMVLGKVR